jgi:hypothetical protein
MTSMPLEIKITKRQQVANRTVYLQIKLPVVNIISTDDAANTLDIFRITVANVVALIYAYFTNRKNPIGRVLSTI